MARECPNAPAVGPPGGGRGPCFKVCKLLLLLQAAEAAWQSQAAVAAAEPPRLGAPARAWLLSLLPARLPAHPFPAACSAGRRGTSPATAPTQRWQVAAPDMAGAVAARVAAVRRLAWHAGEG